MAGVRFQLTPSAPAVGAPDTSRVTAMSWSPPPHIAPWLIIMMCAESVAMAPTIGWLPMARS